MHNVDLILVLAAGFTSALIFGYISERLHLSPIVGYLFAGIVVGPFTPGFVADQDLAAQVAEIGVILLMFGVGLHFHLRDLLAVRKVAIPGAIGQIAISTVLGAGVAVAWGWDLSGGVVLGLAVSVASTVVLTRVLIDSKVLDSPQGHMAVGWLIVEDIFTVFVLVMLPVYARFIQVGEEAISGLKFVGLALLQVAALGAVVLLAGWRAIPWLLTHLARTRSRELFTLAVLAIAIVIATASAKFFGASYALGAFLAGMVVGRSKVGNQAAADALPMRDAFAVLFFVSIGMLFDPSFLIENPGLILAIIAIILIAKPLAALTLVIALGYSVRAALTAAFALAQIGEFSFILASAALGLRLISQDAQSALIAAALFTISLNPILFRRVGGIERWLRSKPRLWSLLNRASIARGKELNDLASAQVAGVHGADRAIVVGYGPVGQTVTRILGDFEIHPVVIELNIDTVTQLTEKGVTTFFGDAARREVLVAAGIKSARFLVVTIPDLVSRIPIIALAREINPGIIILVRARYIAERMLLEDLGASAVSFEELEAAVGLSQFLLQSVGVKEELIEKETDKIRQEFATRGY